MTRYFGIIPAAGIGQRFKAELPKQYAKIGHRAILEYSIEALLALPCIEKCVVVLNPEDKCWPNLSYSQHPKVMTTIGGKERRDSVLQGLMTLTGIAAADDYVLVHDAARPFVPLQDLENLIVAAQQSNYGAILAAPLVDTIKQSQNGSYIERTIPRQGLFRALTPQCFPYQALFAALGHTQQQGLNITDEAMAFELLGRPPKIVPGNPWNIKITYFEDLTAIKGFLEV